MSKRYLIKEYKQAVYTYEVFANSEAEAWEKFDTQQAYVEVGLDFVGTVRAPTISMEGKASDSCATCGDEYSPENVRDYECKRCSTKNKRSKHAD